MGGVNFDATFGMKFGVKHDLTLVKSELGGVAANCHKQGVSCPG
jgi:hypothetical protein